MGQIKIATLGTPHDYKRSLIPTIIKYLGWNITWSTPSSCDLLVLGSFHKTKKNFRFLPRKLRKPSSKLINSIIRITGRKYSPPLTLFHTNECLRHNHINADFSISSDLGVSSKNHLRIPYWYEILDWSDYKLGTLSNPRYGSLISIKRLLEPLGSEFISRSRKCVFFSSHLREPRQTLYSFFKKHHMIDAYGIEFSAHKKGQLIQEDIVKQDILPNYSFNLCPENNLYPGYYTEKIPESFNSGCLPVTWTDECVHNDFNPKAFLNLHRFHTNLSESLDYLLSDDELKRFTEEPLLLKKPKLDGSLSFVSEILAQS